MLYTTTRQVHHQECISWLKAAGGIIQGLPDNQCMSLLTERQKTLTFWVPVTREKLNKFAEAGFFYTGVDDRIQCFHCSLSLQHWSGEINGDPWETHAALFPYCAHMRQCKGDKYILNILEKQPMQAQPKPLRDNKNEERERTEDVEESISLDIDILEKENETLRNKLMCKMCISDVARIVIKSCGHIASCAQCFPALRICPFCRALITQRVRVSYGNENV